MQRWTDSYIPHKNFNCGGVGYNNKECLVTSGARKVQENALSNDNQLYSKQSDVSIVLTRSLSLVMLINPQAL